MIFNHNMEDLHEAIGLSPLDFAKESMALNAGIKNTCKSPSEAIEYIVRDTMKLRGVVAERRMKILAFYTLKILTDMEKDIG